MMIEAPLTSPPTSSDCGPRAGAEAMSALETYVRESRPELARLCAHYTGDRAAADDLTQETLYEAWRRLDRLDDAEALPRWLAGIARNVCRRWLRAHGRDRAHLTGRTERDTPDAMDANHPNTALETVADAAGDFTLDLEREELAAVLDQALALLSPETRTVVLARLLHDVPQSEVALRLGLSEGAVALRLSRGRLALRRVLTPALAAAPGTVREAPWTSGWRGTSLWCTVCGARRLEGYFDVMRQELILRCPVCDRGSSSPFCHHVSYCGLFDGVCGVKPAYSRVLRWGVDYYRDALTAGEAICQHCGLPAPLRMGSLDDTPGDTDQALPIFHVVCARCGYPTNNATLDFLLLGLPETKQFWRQHPRMRRLTPRPLETDGREALLVGFESVTETARLEALVTRDTFATLGVHVS